MGKIDLSALTIEELAEEITNRRAVNAVVIWEPKDAAYGAGGKIMFRSSGLIEAFGLVKMMELVVQKELSTGWGKGGG